ncbi:flagellar hook-length control protein FliK [Falsiroseomonas selenitidurans]|nr:flagellar hook-length control protein FliK [Falsiroseomonas selenitidurans]
MAQAARPGGESRLMVALRPAELGGVEVTVTAREGEAAQVRILAERPETLALLQRDRAALEQAMAQAGVDPQAGALSLGLFDQREAPRRQPESRRPVASGGAAAVPPGRAAGPPAAIPAPRRAAGLLDLAL